MSESLQTVVDWERFEQQGADFIGHFDLVQMQRLVAVSPGLSGQCEVNLSIDREGSRYRVTGTLSATFDLQCQRCLDPVSHRADVAVDAEIVSELSEGNRHRDVWPLNEERALPLLGLVEDELLLTIDDVPKHADERHCNQDMLRRATEYVPDEDEKAASNPFSVLKDLKH
ncbi:MAG: YceD family protein [Pseudomonadota bacterium]